MREWLGFFLLRLCPVVSEYWILEQCPWLVGPPVRSIFKSSFPYDDKDHLSAVEWINLLSFDILRLYASAVSLGWLLYMYKLHDAIGISSISSHISHCCLKRQLIFSSTRNLVKTLGLWSNKKCKPWFPLQDHFSLKLS